jgi:hypothetical protein
MMGFDHVTVTIPLPPAYAMDAIGAGAVIAAAAGMGPVLAVADVPSVRLRAMVTIVPPALAFSSTL